MELNQKETTILAVDDEPVSLNLVKHNLSKVGFHVVTAQSSTEGLDVLKKNKVNLIMCDIMMPGIDGYEFCKLVKQNPDTRNLPFIFLTAKDQTGDEIRGLRTGAEEYIKKPFDPLVLVTRVQAVIDRHKAALEQEQLIAELKDALAKVKTLSGLLPICANCKKIRDDKGYWSQIETYISEHSEVDFTHGICPKCVKKLYPKQYKKILNKA